MSKSAGNIIDIRSNLLDLEGHDQVSRKVDATFGMVAEGGSSREGENFIERATDELEGMILIASCKMLKRMLIAIFKSLSHDMTLSTR